MTSTTSISLEDLNALAVEIVGATLQVGPFVVRRLSDGWLVDKPATNDREFWKTPEEVLARVNS